MNDTDLPLANAHEEFLSTEITRMDYFAAHAPTEIPDWYEPEPEPYDGPPFPAIPDNASDEDKKMLAGWLNDPVFDLEGEYVWFQEAADAHWKACREHGALQRSHRYMSWRWVYAQMMCITRELFVDPDEEKAMNARSVTPAPRRPVPPTRRRS
jgi:hypothetical protein